MAPRSLWTTGNLSTKGLRMEIKNSATSNRLLFGQAVRTLRKLRGLTQKELAGRIKKSLATISKIESGHHPIDIDTCMDLAAALHTSPLRFMWAVERNRFENDVSMQCIIQLMDTMIAILEKAIAPK